MSHMQSFKGNTESQAEGRIIPSDCGEKGSGLKTLSYCTLCLKKPGI